MHQQHDPALVQYPHGRGYGHDYMRGGEVFGGYGYADREEYARSRGELNASTESDSATGDSEQQGDSRP